MVMIMDGVVDKTKKDETLTINKLFKYLTFRGLLKGKFKYKKEFPVLWKVFLMPEDKLFIEFDIKDDTDKRPELVPLPTVSTALATLYTKGILDPVKDNYDNILNFDEKSHGQNKHRWFWFVAAILTVIVLCLHPPT